MGEAKRESRQYPRICTSMYCGKIECPSECRHLPELQEFKRWKEAHGAECRDKIWSPLFYTATK